MLPNKLLMIHRILLASLFLLFSVGLQAQNPGKTTIIGHVIDTLGVDAAYATVMLLNPTDSTLVNFSRTDETGRFTFKKVKNDNYLFKVSYLGHFPLQIPIGPSSEDVLDLGEINIKPINQALMEVVIKEAKATLSIRGDTVEYDASSFKVPPGSTVEDMLRRLPGIEVDADGNIKAQGRDVRRVYVDGKSFFGDDPKAATKNLGAETLSKIQVYDEASEQTRLTGVEDGKEERAMNLELKEQYKKGSFGKITVAGGTEERWATRGNYNRFNSKEQLSFIGYANNINETGVNWEDYGEFRGQNTFKNYDNGDFGFGGAGGRVFYFSGGGDVPFNNFDGRGFTENYGAGSNYNFDNKKTKFNFSYFYNQIDRTLDQTAFRQTFLQDTTFNNSDTTNIIDFRGNHSIGTRFEQNIDSNNILILKANFRYSLADDYERRNQFFTQIAGEPVNELTIENTANNDTWSVTSAGIFRHYFKKKGRSWALSAGFNQSQTDGRENLFSLNRFFQAQTLAEQIEQLNTADNSSQQFKSSTLFTEPLSKRWFWQSFFNFSLTDNLVNRQVQDEELNGERIDSLSVFYDNRLQYNRLGSSIRYSYNGLNGSAGLAVQQLNIMGSYAQDEGEPIIGDPVDRTFNNLIPYLEVEYEFPNNLEIDLEYQYSVSEPTLSQLQPIPNVNNPFFRSEGNPNLVPERSHSIDMGMSYWNSASFTNFRISTNYDIYDNQIVYNTITEFVDSIGFVTTNRPVNVSGGSRIGGYMWGSVPIIKTKLTLSANGNLSSRVAPAFVNGIENETTNTFYGFGTRLNLTLNQKLVFGLNGNINFTDISYSIQEEQNQNIRNYGLSANTKWQIIPKTYFESNLNYNRYTNDRFDFDQEIPIWNASIRRLLGEKNRIEVRLAAFDLLNRRLAVQQNGSQNFVTNTVSSTLARYFMLSLSYNVRGYEDKVKKRGWW